MKPQHPSSTPGPGGYGLHGGLPHPRGNTQHFEYRAKSAHQHDARPHAQMTSPGPDGMDANAPAFKLGGGSYNLQPTAQAFNGSMNYGPALPMHTQPGMSQQMRGPPGNQHQHHQHHQHQQHHHQHHQQHHQQQYPHQHLRMRGLPRGAVMHQPYMPGGGMNAGAQSYYQHQLQMQSVYMSPGQPHYPGAHPMYASMPPMQDMAMGMGGMPMPVPSVQPPPKRKSKILEIIDPQTGRAITIGNVSTAKQSSSTSSATAAEDTQKNAGEQKKPQEKQPTPAEIPAEKPAAPSPTPITSVTDVEQSETSASVAKAPQASPDRRTASRDSEPAACSAKEPKSTRATNGAKDTTESVDEAAAETPGSKTSESASSATRKTTTTVTSISVEVSSPKQKTQTTKEPAEEAIAAKRPEPVSLDKTRSDQNVTTPTLQQKTLPVKEDDEVQTDVRQKAPASAPVQATTVNVGAQEKSGGKSAYTLELMTSFREQYKDLPATTTGSTWPSMEITSEAAVSRGGSRGGRGGGGAGWERGDKLAGGTGRQGSSRGGSGGGQWARSQDLPKRSGRAEHGGRGDRGDRGSTPDLSLLDGPVKPLTRSANRWIPTKNTSTLEVTKKNVNGIMNKMTREKFERLAGQLTSINMESLEMLQAVIKIIFDKAVGEPHFCDMYADLCVHLETNWKVWSFLKIVQNDDDKTFYWTAMSDSDSEVVGPFDTVSGALESASSDEFEPVPIPPNMKLSEVRVRRHKFIKVWVQEDPTKPQYYWSGQDLDDLGDDQVLNGPYESHEHASRVALKSCSFRRILLNACQEEFEKDNIYEELEQKFRRDKEEGKITPQMATDYEEKRLIMKLRMLGNIRFIGELYRKGMLQERIMHECIMKLMDVRLNSDSTLICVHPNDPPDEESIESLAKLLTTMGKDLDKHGAQGCMPSYFRYLESKLVKDKRLSSRITFMIKDVIELRQHKWEPRRKELKQKTLTEIRKEAEREARAPPSSAPSGGGRGRGDRDQFRSDRRSNAPRDAYNNGRSTMAPVYQHSQSMNSRGSNNQQVTFIRGIGARDDSVQTGPSGRPAHFGMSARQGGRGNSASPASFSGSRRGPAAVTAKKPQSPTHTKVIAPLSDEIRESIGKKAKSTAEEYASIVDLKEADICLVESQKEHMNHEDVNCVFAFEILKGAIDAKAEVRAKMVELLEKLSLETKSLTFVGIRYAIERMIELCGDLWCDVPKLHEQMADFVMRFMKNPSLTGVSLDWVLGKCLQSVDKAALNELIDGGFLAALLGETLKLLTTTGVEKATKEIRATNITVLSVFPSYKQSATDMQEWIKKYDLEAVFSLEPAFGLVNHMNNASSYEEIVAFIENNIPDALLNDSFFATYTCLFILNLSKEGEQLSAERCMLLTGFCGTSDTQVRLVSAIFQTRNDNDLVKKLLKHLVKEGAVAPLAFSKWLELPNDDSVSRKRVQEELGQFVEELARTK
ncbi:unnamed protein product [Hyaloperonospora brassicae]|uniref:MI domain-containing protein n=1 Tax=Hyaloperonospora brassicae TaxID=162125 RepID=A0AAV0TEK8_HYABA|nr:unnamed protein product [Hyaloperonospora brassicae]